MTKKDEFSSYQFSSCPGKWNFVKNGLVLENFGMGFRNLPLRIKVFYKLFYKNRSWRSILLIRLTLTWLWHPESLIISIWSFIWILNELQAIHDPPQQSFYRLNKIPLSNDRRYGMVRHFPWYGFQKMWTDPKIGLIKFDPCRWVTQPEYPNLSEQNDR